jgi:aryl-alcohol dehydrogenase-like predicted oxidoreductase
VSDIAQERRAQFGRFLLGTGNIGGIATTTGPGIGLSEPEGLDLIDRALEEGIAVIDTSDAYTGGASERVVGEWNRAHPDSGVLIQTKTGVRADGPDLSPGRVAQQLAHSIETLGRVDLYLAHVVDPHTPWSESLPVFSEAVESGRIRAYGLSNVDEAALASALETADRLGLTRPQIVQNSFSLIQRRDDAGVLPIVESERLVYEPYSPLSNGILAGRYSRGDRPATGSRASIASGSAVFLDDAELMARVRAFDDLAETHGVSSAGLALAWLTNHPLVTAPIIGVSRPAQWQGVREAAALAWSAQLETQVDALFPSPR